MFPTASQNPIVSRAILNVSSVTLLFVTKHISVCTFFPLTENVGLLERQEGRGLFPESGWSHAVVQVTGRTHSVIADSRSGVFNNSFPLFQCSGSECF